jgi:hypothetical protein
MTATYEVCLWDGLMCYHTHIYISRLTELGSGVQELIVNVRWIHRYRAQNTRNFTLTKPKLWSWALLKRSPVVQQLKTFPVFHGNWRFIATFTSALHWSLFRARQPQYITPHPISLRSILILSTHLHLSLPSDLFPCGFHTYNIYAFVFVPVLETWSANLIPRELLEIYR